MALAVEDLRGAAPQDGAELQDVAAPQGTHEEGDVKAMTTCMSNAHCLQMYPPGNAPYCCSHNGGPQYRSSFSIPCGVGTQCPDGFYCASIGYCVALHTACAST